MAITRFMKNKLLPVIKAKIREVFFNERLYVSSFVSFWEGFLAKILS